MITRLHSLFSLKIKNSFLKINWFWCTNFPRWVYARCALLAALSVLHPACEACLEGLCDDCAHAEGEPHRDGAGRRGAHETARLEELVEGEFALRVLEDKAADFVERCTRHAAAHHRDKHLHELPIGRLLELGETFAECWNDFTWEWRRMLLW